MSIYRQQLEEWLSRLDVRADTVLDIGGAQGHVKDRAKSWNVKAYHILDLPDYDLESQHNRPFPLADVIFCLEVFEYLINPLQALRNISRQLLLGGKAYITFAFCYPHHNELEMDALRYTEPGIKRLASQAGLKVKSIEYRVDKTGLLEQFYHADGMRTAKQYAHHDVTGFIVELVK